MESASTNGAPGRHTAALSPFSHKPQTAIHLLPHSHSHSHSYPHTRSSSPISLSRSHTHSHYSAPARAIRGTVSPPNALSRTGAPASATWQGATWQAVGLVPFGVSEGAFGAVCAVIAAAKRKGNGASAVAEGEELDEDLRTGLNEVPMKPPFMPMDPPPSCPWTPPFMPMDPLHAHGPPPMPMDPPSCPWTPLMPMDPPASCPWPPPSCP